MIYTNEATKWTEVDEKEFAEIYGYDEVGEVIVLDFVPGKDEKTLAVIDGEKETIRINNELEYLIKRRR